MRSLGRGIEQEGRAGNLGQAESRGNKRCSFKLQSIEGRGFFLFLPKGSEKGEGDRQVSPFTPSCPGRVLPGLLRGGKGFYVSSVIMLLGPPGTIPRRACCGGCIYDSRKYKKPLRAFIELWTILNEIFYTTFQNTADPGENIQIQLFNIIVVPFIDDGKACTNAGCQFVARDIAVMEDLL